MPVSLVQKDSIGIITVDNPATLNALSEEILKALDTQICSVCEDASIRVVIITGVGKSFVAGADISSMVNMTSDEAEAFANLGSNIFRKIEKSDKVFIAAINGYALGGGCELALACDLRVASKNAKFGLPEVSLGVFPGFSGIRRLVDIVGEAKTKELVFTGKRISASNALDMQLVNMVVEEELLYDEAQSLAMQIVSNSYNAISKAKRAINLLSGSSEQVIKNHCSLFAECFLHPDQKEGMRAFLEKRKPIF